MLPVTNRDAGDEAALDSNQVISGCYRTLRTTPYEAPRVQTRNSAIGRKANWRCFRPQMISPRVWALRAYDHDRAQPTRRGKVQMAATAVDAWDERWATPEGRDDWLMPHPTVAE